MVSHGTEPPPRVAAPRTGGSGGPGRGSGWGSEPVWRPWRTAWLDAAYADAGFWSREQPGDHFATGVGAGPLVAAAVAGLAPRDVGVVVDVGAGDGALLARLLDLLPGVPLVGVDRRPRPAGLDPRVGWVEDHWDVDGAAWRAGGPGRWCGTARAPLLVAHEWLDDLPVPVVVRQPAGWHEVEVDEGGRERVGAPVGAVDADWLARWWPPAARPVGARAEVGRARDEAWAHLVRDAAGRGGRALAVDYGHLAADRPADGSLTAYGRGRRRAPVPDGGVNLTAAVAVDALAAAGTAAGADTLRLERQAAVLADHAEPGPPTGPSDPLARLVRRAERAALTSPERWGGLWWLLQGVS